MKRKECTRKTILLMLLALPIMFSACSKDEDPHTGMVPSDVKILRSSIDVTLTKDQESYGGFATGIFEKESRQCFMYRPIELQHLSMYYSAQYLIEVVTNTEKTYVFNRSSYVSFYSLESIVGESFTINLYQVDPTYGWDPEHGWRN